MIEVADIFRQHAAAYRAHHTLLPQELRAMRDIEFCRTAFFGGHVAQCDHCAEVGYTYHSCRNRHCPKCHGEQSAAWLEKQQSRLLPCPHYLLTFTLPADLRPLARQHPKMVYGLLLRCAAAATQKLAANPQYLGANPAILAVLHTWTRALLYHPHVHLLVSAGGWTQDQRWAPPKHPNFFVPVRALSVLFRAKMRHALAQAHRLEPTPEKTWTQPWVVHCQHAGAGEKVLGYLARYAFRVAITNSRLEAFADGQVTFRYRDNRTQQLQRVTLCAEEFIGRFMQHILPPGFSQSAPLRTGQRQPTRRSGAGASPDQIYYCDQLQGRQNRRLASRHQSLRPVATLSALPHRASDRRANPPPAKKISTLMLLLPLQSWLWHRPLGPTQTGKPPAAQPLLKSPQTSGPRRNFPARGRTNLSPWPPPHPHRDAPSIPGQRPISKEQR